MATVTDLRGGIADSLTTIVGLRAHATVPGQVSPPAALVTFQGVDYDDSAGTDKWTFHVTVLVSPAAVEAGQDKLDSYIAPTGAESVRTAVEADGTLGGVADDTRVGSVQNYGSHEFGGQTYLGATWVVEVWA